MGAGRAADRRLVPFIALVTVSGVSCLGWAIFHLSTPSSWLYVGVVAALVTVAVVCAPRLRIGGEPHRVTCASATILVALAVLPAPWALIGVAIGTVVPQLTGERPRLHKIAFNSSAHIIAVGVASAVVNACGLSSALAIHPSLLGFRQVTAILVAAATYAIVDELLTPTVIVLASRLPWRVVMSRDADIRSGVRVANLLVALGAVALLDLRLDFILVMPFAIAVVYLAGSQRLVRRAEQRTTAHLALATADLAGADLTTVLHRAAHAAVRLLSAAEADVEANIGSDVRLVRVHHDAIVYDGPALTRHPGRRADARARRRLGPHDRAHSPAVQDTHDAERP